MTTTTRALITAEELHRAALDSLSTDLETADDRGAVTAICESASRMVENHLGRQLMVHLDTVYIHQLRWRSAVGHATLNYETDAPKWPMVERTSTDVVTAGTDRPGRQIWYADSLVQLVTGYFGYKRPDQTLGELQGLGGDLASLTVLPTDLPYDIRDSALTIALALADQRMHAQFSGQQVAQTVGTNQAVRSALQMGVVQDALERIRPYKVLA